MVNVVFLQGYVENISRPEKMKNGKTAVMFHLKTDNGYTEKDKGKLDVPCAIQGKQAENFARDCRNGLIVIIQGSLLRLAKGFMVKVFKYDFALPSPGKKKKAEEVPEADDNGVVDVDLDLAID